MRRPDKLQTKQREGKDYVLRITAKKRRPVDLDKLAVALLSIVDDLPDPEKQRLAKVGRERLKQLDQQDQVRKAA